MKTICVAALLGAALAAGLHAQNPFLGRWDITVTTPTASYPGWMELADEGGSLKARIQPRAGSVRPAAAAKIENGHLLLTAVAASANRPAMTWDLTAEGGAKLTGVQKRGDQEAGRIAAVRAPELNRPAPKKWTRPEPLFNGKDLTGWEPDNPSKNHWTVRDGNLVNESGGANLRGTRKFDDFRLHLELNCPDKGNSGIYLRGRYEMQIEYEPAGVEDAFHSMGAIYGFVAAKPGPRKPGEWETFDITLVGRRVTIVRNGDTIVDNQEIAGITGGALDSNEGEPGPFYIQGDHTGGILFRNITISVPAK